MDDASVRDGCSSLSHLSQWGSLEGGGRETCPPNPTAEVAVAGVRGSCFANPCSKTVSNMAESAFHLSTISFLFVLFLVSLISPSFLIFNVTTFKYIPLSF